MAMMTLTRKGTITVARTSDDRAQCGLRGTRRLLYRVKIVCHESLLDENGFLVDQLEVDRRIRRRYRNMDRFPSCERLALDIARFVFRRLCPEGTVAVTASVGASREAYMTVTIQEGEA